MNQPESLEAVVARIDERVAGLVARIDSYTEIEVMLRADISMVKEEARRENTAVRVDLERQIHDVAADLAKHEEAVNPHPRQEDWLRRSTDRLTGSIEGLRADLQAVRNDFTSAKGSLSGAARVLYPLGSVGLLVGGAYLNHFL